MRSLIFLVALSLTSAPARAQLDAWRSMGEEALHTSTFANFDGNPADIFAPCERGKLTLPRMYSKDYKLSDRDRRSVERGLQAVKKYSDIKTAIADGYLPSTRGFVPSVGLLMIHPDLVRDGVHNLDKPDVLTYVKKKGASQFRLVGVIYAGGKSEPKGTGDFDERARIKGTRNKAGTDSWDYDDEVCVIVKPGESVSLFYGNEVPHHCKDGLFFKRMWRLYTWALVYSPEGLFAEKNPLVDFIDSTQLLGPVCPKGKGK